LKPAELAEEIEEAMESDKENSRPENISDNRESVQSQNEKIKAFFSNPGSAQPGLSSSRNDSKRHPRFFLGVAIDESLKQLD
jgi:hypothetical protein